MTETYDGHSRKNKVDKMTTQRLKGTPNQKNASNRSKYPDYRTLAKSDRIPPPPPILEEACEPIEYSELPPSSYTSQAQHDLEAQHLWPSTWQMACRLEHIPKVGDHIVYDICNTSIVVVRVSEDTIKAYHNSCLHRGTTLVEEQGNASLFRCPFHGWAWSLDGTFKGMTSRDDFSQVDNPDLCLPEAAVAIWSGFVMVNPDRSAPPFEEYSAPLTEHFAHFPLDNHYTQYHVSHAIDANWKVVQEAFLEAYHIRTVHTHTVRFANDQDCVYDVFGENVSRVIQPIALPAERLSRKTSELELAKMLQPILPKEDHQAVPDDVQTREWLAERSRVSFARQFQHDFSDVSDALMLDTIQYFMFPNFCPWAGHAIPMAFRFKPWENDPNKSTMEVMILRPIPDDGIYETAEVYHLEPDEQWVSAPGFEMYGIVFDQDMDNLPRIQKGLKAATHKNHLLADYQEIRLRHFRARMAQVMQNKGQPS